MDDLLTLIAETFQADEIGVMIPQETRRTVWVRLESINRAEWYRAGLAGMRPELVAITPHVNYAGEKTAELGGKRYSIYRTYRAAESDEIELYLEERTGGRVGQHD